MSLANLFYNCKKKTTLFVCLGGEKEEGDDGQDLRRTESDSGLKKVFLSKVHFLSPPCTSSKFIVFETSLL